MPTQRILDKYLGWNPTTKRFQPHEARRYILPFHSYFDLSDVAGGYPLQAAGTPSRLAAWKQPFSSINGMDANLGTPLHIDSLLLANSAGYDASNFLVTLNEVGETRKFMNKPIHARTIFGDARYPCKMPEKYMFASQHQIQAQFENLPGQSAQTIYPFLTGAQYYPWAAQTNESRQQIISMIKIWNARRAQVWPFWLTTEADVTLPANGAGSYELLPGQDAHFIASQFAVVSTGDFEYSLMEVKTQQGMSNGRATRNNALGDARLPTRLPKEYVVPAGYRLRLYVKDLSGAENRIHFTIHGIKVYAPLQDVPEVAQGRRHLDMAQA